jgi:hypothetical protein
MAFVWNANSFYVLRFPLGAALYFVCGLLLFSAILTLVLARSLERPARSVAPAHT